MKWIIYIKYYYEISIMYGNRAILISTHILDFLIIKNIYNRNINLGYTVQHLRHAQKITRLLIRYNNIQHVRSVTAINFVIVQSKNKAQINLK